MKKNHVLASGITAFAAGAVALAPVASASPEYYIYDKDGKYIGASYVNMTDQELVGTFAQRVQDQIVQAPFVGLVLASGVAEGDTLQVQEQVRQQIDAPQYVVDPLIELVARKLPAPIGGTNGNPGAPQGGPKAILTGPDPDGALMNWRNETLLPLRDEIDLAVNGVTVRPADNNRAADLAGAVMSGDRAAIVKASSFLEPNKVVPNIIAKATQASKGGVVKASVAKHRAANAGVAAAVKKAVKDTQARVKAATS